MSTSLPPPPIRHHLTTCIPQSRALDLISAYVAAANTSTEASSTTNNTSSTSPLTIPLFTPSGAALHPNALLTEAGPVAPSGGVAGLVLRNLERVRAGLRGEIWAAEPEGEGEGEKGWEGAKNGEGDLRVEMEVERMGGEGENVAQEGWQDKEEFERQQELEVGVSDEDTTGKGVPKVKVAPERLGEEARLLKERSSVDKEDRKKRKKEKRTQEKRERETKRRKDAAPGG